MKPRFLAKEFDNQQQSIAYYIQTVENQLSSLKAELSGLSDDKDSDYQQQIDSLVAHYIPLVDGLQLAYTAILDANQELAHHYYTEIKSRHLKIKFSHYQLGKIETKIAKLKNQEKLYFWQKWRLHRLQKKKERVSKQLKCLQHLDQLHPDIFEEIEHIQKIIKAGLLTSQQVTDELPPHIQWQSQLQEAAPTRTWNQWSQVKQSLPLDQLAPRQLKAFQAIEETLFYQLYYTDGWDFPAILAFNHYLINRLNNDKKTPETIIEQLVSIERKKVGSPSYLILFKNSHYSAKEKIDLLLNQLGGVIDKHQMLQLTGSFVIDTKLSPHSLFIELFCQTVQKAYLNETLDSPKIHQLRMYFDRQNINYIRHEFPAATDEASLIKYVNTPFPKGLNGQALIRERGRLHNKTPKNMPYTSYISQSPNRKRLTPNFHSEFILDKHGHFVSQWNILKTNGHLVVSDPKAYTWDLKMESQLLNTESLNYGKKNNQEHKRLDSIPPSAFDHKLRKKARRNWISPAISQYSFRKVDKRRHRSI